MMLKNKSAFSTKKRKQLMFYIGILALPILQVLVFYFYVNINTFSLAFQEFDGMGYKFAGLDTFKKVFKLEHTIFRNFDFKLVMKNSLLVWLIGLLISFFPSLLFSYYIYKNHIGSGLFKIMLYLPHIIPHLVFITLYKFYMDTIPVNLGLITSGGFWISTVEWERFYYIFCGWMLGFGTSVLVYTGSMSGISDSIIESGQLDGITPLKEFIFIVLPMIWGTFVTMVVASLVSIFTSDMNGYAFKAANFNSQIQTIGYFLQNKTINGGMESYPLLSALGLIMTAIAVPLALLVRHLLTKYGPKTE
ncbi:MAG: sugar ABC transporter permease [Clostridiales bacterium]|nr:sugar ABC transporter permease [Clostridiales bacterium]